MSQYFKFPMPIVQAIGLVCVPSNERDDAGWVERKPVAAAVVTLSQRDDGHVTIFHEVMNAIDEMQFPLPWLVEQELVAGAPTLVGSGDAVLLSIDSAQQRFFVEPKVQDLKTGSHVIDVTGLAGEGIGEAGLCRRLGIPLLEMGPTEANRVWTWFPHDARAAALGQQALGKAVSRLMLWANLMAACESEPGWFYETMLALRCWFDERETDAPALYGWATCKPVMRAVSFVEDYRRDLGRRLVGLERDWPEFSPGLFHT